ncbi:hypothetical protein M9Y10_043465 [Tritrichomonas musculus]|uniref:UDENN domain-containing protein n=1 Tax=Tritrichomonas musculus TaxID=1915356 RepID=A0ABR2JZR1_9EUKA
MNDSTEKTRFLRFYQGYDDEDFFENFSIWLVEKDGSHKTLQLNYPEDRQPLAGTADQIAPSPDALPNLEEHHPFFHFSSLCPEDGIRVVYSLIFLTKEKYEIHIPSKSVTIQEGALTILVVESKFLHPVHFKAILTHIYNDIHHGEIQEVFNLYSHPPTIHNNFTLLFEALPFDISTTAEIGRFHHFLFSIFQPNQVLIILIHLILSLSVIVTSIDTTKLCAGCFSLLSLLYPIIWPCVFISTLPSNLIETVNSPFPFIIGVPFKFFLRNDMKNVEVDTFVNLDCGNFISSANLDFDAKINTLISKVSDLLNNELEICKKYRGFPAFRIQLILWQFLLALMLISANMTDADLSDPQLKRRLAEALQDKKKKRQSKKNSVQHILYDSIVIDFLCEHITSGFTKYIPDDFFKVLSSQSMKELMASIH